MLGSEELFFKVHDIDKVCTQIAVKLLLLKYFGNTEPISVRKETVFVEFVVTPCSLQTWLRITFSF